MPNKYADGTVRFPVRMPEELRARLEAVAQAASAKYGDISATAIARKAIEDKITELENDLGISAPIGKKKK